MSYGPPAVDNYGIVGTCPVLWGLFVLNCKVVVFWRCGLNVLLWYGSTMALRYDMSYGPRRVDT